MREYSSLSDTAKGKPGEALHRSQDDSYRTSDAQMPTPISLDLVGHMGET